MGCAVIGLLAIGCADPFGTGPEVWDDPVPHDDDGDWVFAPRIERMDLEVGPEAEAILASERLLTEPRTWVEADATVDFEDAGRVGLRMRGGSGSFQRWGQKPKLQLDFNRVTGERFHGLEGLSLNNAKMDCSAVGESLAALVFAEVGVPASRVGWAQLFVNGADYGLYVVVETQDDRFLDRAFDDDDANLYDGSYRWAGWLPYFLDFAEGRDHRFDLEEGDDVGFRDLLEISAGVERALADERLPSDLREGVDWDEVLRFAAADQWLGNEDGYPTNRNNYDVVFPTDAPMAVVPWDLDATFRETDADRWTRPKGHLLEACVADRECRARYAEVAREVAETLEGLDWAAAVETRLALTQEGVDGDPRRRCSDDELTERRDRVAGWASDASDRLRAAWR